MSLPLDNEKAGQDSHPAPLNEKLQAKLDSRSPPVYSDSLKNKVEFEDYLYLAAVQRREEDLQVAAGANSRFKFQLFEKLGSSFSRLSEHKGQNVNIKVVEDSIPPPTADELERENASRALRLASWASVFYLITTDILGPFNAPYAISLVGWVPGVILYVVMGFMALYTGLILWRLFVRLDSARHPLKTYGDIAERIFGKAARHTCTVLQSIQLLFNVGTICLGNGQALSQMTRGRLCFSVCILIWTLVGYVFGQIRTLKNYGWLANGAVWINLLLIFISMGFVAHSPPNFAAAQISLGVPPGPVKTVAFVAGPLYLRVNGIMNMVFAYGGAMIFPEMMAEMRRPMDFWKGMALAQSVIFSAYLLYGAFIYAFQGQFTLPFAYQGVSKYSWQTVGNALALVTGIIAAGLYGNIGIKIAYINIIEGWFKGPPLLSYKGRIIWTIFVFAYWSLAFVIGSAIPQVGTIVSLVAAVAIMQFTYTFPPILRFGYDVITDAMAADAPYVPGQGSRGRVDTWRQWSRWKRGLFGGRWYYKLFNFILFLASAAMACLGMWGAGESIKATFAIAGSATSFGCASPVA